MTIPRHSEFLKLACLIAVLVFGALVVGMDRRDGAATANEPAQTVHPGQEGALSDPVDARLQNFRMRCHAAGVLKCVDFDDDAWFQQGSYLFPAWDGVYRATRDTAMKYSGAASLRFEIPGHTPSDAAGYWAIGFGKDFGENSVFYVQYRMRLNDVMAKGDWDKMVGSSWKQSIFHSRGTTCGNIELTTVEYGWNDSHPFPVMYTSCGAKSVYTNEGNPPTKLQQGDYNCWYGQFNSSCFYYLPNEWLAFYYRVAIGNWGKSNSSIEAWVARENQPFKKWIDLPNFTLNKHSDSSTYNWITLLPYMTNKNINADHPTGYMWFDELIVSTQPIPAPATTP